MASRGRGSSGRARSTPRWRRPKSRTSAASRTSCPPASCTVAQLDAAIREAGDTCGGGTVSVLGRTRELLARAEQARAARPPQYVSEHMPAVALFCVQRSRERAGYADGQISVQLERVQKAPEAYGLDTADVAHLARIGELLGAVAAAPDCESPQRARSAGGPFHFSNRRPA